MSERNTTTGKRKMARLIEAAGGQVRLAELSGISQPMIHRFKSGLFDRMSLRAYAKLKRAAGRLGITLNPEDFL